jgi:hypothetical protein
VEEINRRWLETVRAKFPGDEEKGEKGGYHVG